MFYKKLKLSLNLVILNDHQEMNSKLLNEEKYAIKSPKQTVFAW